MTEPRDDKPADPMAGIHWDLDKSISYSQYLQLDKVLAAQKPLSGQHDEMLFLIIHQASELWMKLCLHELSATRAQIRNDDLEPAFKMLSRKSVWTPLSSDSLIGISRLVLMVRQAHHEDPRHRVSASS